MNEKNKKKKYMIFINRLSIYLKLKSRKYLHPYNLCVKKISKLFTIS